MPRSIKPTTSTKSTRSAASNDITITKVEVTEFAYELEDIGKD